MKLLLITITSIILIALTSCSRHSDKIANDSSDSIRNIPSLPSTLKIKRNYLSQDSLLAFVKNAKNNIHKPLKGKPFNSINFNKVIVYEFYGGGTYEKPDPYTSIFNRDGKFVPVITKQNALSQGEVNKITRLLSESSTYGDGWAACFDPHLAIVFYNDTARVMDISICLACNSLISSIEIPAKEKAAESYGFSKSGRAGIKELCDNFGYYYEKNSLHDE